MHRWARRGSGCRVARLGGVAVVTVATVVAVGSPAIARAVVAVPIRPPQPGYTVVADGLANARGLAITTVPGHKYTSEVLYVTEAGLGAGTATTGVRLGTGSTGRVLAVQDPDTIHPQTTVVSSGLWSQSTPGPDGVDTLGPAGITVATDGTLSVVMAEHYVPGLGPQPQQGHLLHFTAQGQITSVVDVATASLQWANTPSRHTLGPSLPDSNPAAVTTLGFDTIVVDSAAATVSVVSLDGTVVVLASLPDTPHGRALPTCVTTGPDGALYVGTLASTEGAGGATVYRIDPHTTAAPSQAATVWAGGVSTISGCAFSPDGRFFYASELTARETVTHPPTPGNPAGAQPSAVVRIPFDHPTTRDYLGLGVLQLAGGIAIDVHGSIYVTNSSNHDTGAPLGQVLRFDPTARTDVCCATPRHVAYQP